jgi:ribosomal protein L35
MPKNKTHRGAAKRFKVTGRGTRRLGRELEVTGGQKKHVERLLGRA